ncbi:hypothetical protein ACFL1I_08600 [Candidatus Omnitrophota bacterium]
MGTILFLIMKLIFKFNTAGYDFAILCLLVSLDSIACGLLWRCCKKS